jgi:chromosome partitioning protein
MLLSDKSVLITFTYMPAIISIFNNKGGVGKTTYMFHIAHLLEKHGKTVLMVDCDSQCNLTAYTLPESVIERAWNEERGNSIWRAIERVYRGIGDIRQRGPSQINLNYPNLYIVPGDLLLSNYEDLLGDTWNSARGGSEPSLRVQSAIYRYINWAANRVHADVIMVDLGPNLGALNRAVLGASDYFIVPVSPDLFSIRGTENLGSKLEAWRQGWEQCNAAWNNNSFALPHGRPTFLGYVMQQHNIRQESEEGMTKGWQIFGNRIESAIQRNIVDKLTPFSQVHYWSDNTFNLGKIPNLHSLIPYSLEAQKPVFDCTGSDGLRGAHISRARDSVAHFQPIAQRLLSVVNQL